MKLAFSTLACPGWNMNEVISTAKDLGYHGIEIRGLENELFAPDIKVFSKPSISNTLSRIKNIGIEISALSCGSGLAIYENWERAVDEAKAYIGLASKLDVKYIRVLGTLEPQPSGGDIEQLRRLYGEICRYGSALGVRPLLETNGMMCDSRLLADFMESISEENKGVLWDIHHTVRYNSEDVAYTVGNIGKYIYNVHVKDSLVVNGLTQYKMMGYGDIPCYEAVKRLKKIGYDGFLTLEWVKRWNNELEEPGIVLSHYVGYMNSLLRKL